jgi:hypothetical protein
LVYSVEPKYDGGSIAVVYENDKLFAPPREAMEQKEKKSPFNPAPSDHFHSKLNFPLREFSALR